MYFTESLGEGQITLPDPAGLPQDLAEDPGQNGRQDKADQDQAQPVKAGGDDGGCPSGEGLLTGGEPAGPHADLSAQAAGAHSGVDGAPFISSPNTQVAMGPEMAEASVGRDPDPGIFHNVGHLEHGGAQALGDQTAPAVFLEGHNGEAHHLGAAMHHGGSARQSGQAQHGADGGRGDGKGEGDAHQDGYGDPHPEGLELGGVVNDQAEGAGGGADRGAMSLARATPIKMVTPGVTRISTLVSLLTIFPHSAAMMAMIRTASGPPAPPSALAAQPTAAREKDHGIGLQGISDGDCHSRAGDGHGIGANVDEVLDGQLLPQGLDDGADEQRAEQTLGHSAQGIDPIALG